MTTHVTRMRPNVAPRGPRRATTRRTVRPLDEPLRALLAARAPAIYRFALNMTGSERVASHVVYDTVAAALGELALLTSRESIGVWVWNLATESAAEACSRGGLRLVPPISTETERSAFWGVLSSLAIDDRIAYLLHELEELSDADVAWILETTEADVRQRVHHVRLCLCPLVADLTKIEAA